MVGVATALTQQAVALVNLAIGLMQPLLASGVMLTKQPVLNGSYDHPVVA